MALGRYLDLLRAPGVVRLVVASTLGRLPYGMNVLALILLLRAEGFGYAEVGIVTGAAGLAIGVTAPLLGRVVDRLGQTRVLATTAVLYLSADIRTLWPELVGRERLDTAFAFDALQLELFFILGPLLAAGLATLISPEVAFLSGVTMVGTGALAFAAAPASRRWRPAPTPDGPRAGALSVPGMRTLFASLTIAAVGIGALEIAIPAFAEREASRGDSGWLFALWAVRPRRPATG